MAGEPSAEAASADKSTSAMPSRMAESSFQVVLHPLVVLNISDYITRHTLRGLKGPVVGGIMGHNNGRQITLAHAFEIKVDPSSIPDIWQLDKPWLEARVEQMCTVHTDKKLDLVGWYSLLPPDSAETAPQALLQAQSIQAEFNSIREHSPLLVAFYPEELLAPNARDAAGAGGRLPITVYDSQQLAPTGSGESTDHYMTGTEAPAASSSAPHIRFRPLSYAVDTDDAEMISMDHIAAGAKSASAVVPTLATTSSSTADTAAKSAQSKPAFSIVEGDSKGKKRLVAAEDESSQPLGPVAADPAAGTSAGPALRAPVEDRFVVLTPAEEELIASLTTRINAGRMLHSRIELIIDYLDSLWKPESASSPGPRPHASPEILRSIRAVVARLGLAVPSGSADDFAAELARERTDAALVGVLNAVAQSVRDARDVGRAAYVAEEQGAPARQGGGAAGSRKQTFDEGFGSSSRFEGIGSGFGSYDDSFSGGRGGGGLGGGGGGGAGVPSLGRGQSNTISVPGAGDLAI